MNILLSSTVFKYTHMYVFPNLSFLHSPSLSAKVVFPHLQCLNANFSPLLSPCYLAHHVYHLRLQTFFSLLASPLCSETYNYSYISFRERSSSPTCPLNVRFNPGWCGSMDWVLACESPVWFPVRAHAWVVGQVSSWGQATGNHTLMFSPSLSPSLPLSLKINKQNL